MLSLKLNKKVGHIINVFSLVMCPFLFSLIFLQLLKNNNSLENNPIKIYDILFSFQKKYDILIL